jgi:hypothetical protein
MLELASIPTYVNYLLRQQQGFKVGWIGQVMAVNESSRLQQSLQKEGVPVKRLIINQILPPSSSDCKFCAIKRKVCTADGRGYAWLTTTVLCLVVDEGSHRALIFSYLQSIFAGSALPYFALHCVLFLRM